MRSLLAPLTHREESTLRKIGFGGAEAFDPAHIRRLLQLDLIEWSGSAWRLTPLGGRRHEALVTAAVRPFAA